MMMSYLLYPYGKVYRWCICRVIVKPKAMSTVLTTPCAVINTLLNHILFFILRLPFTTSMGLKRDTTIAGMMPLPVGLVEGTSDRSMSYCRCPDVTFTLKKDFSKSWSSSRFSFYNAMNYWSFLPFTQLSIQCWRLGVWTSRPHPPVRRLLKCGDCRFFGKRRNYASIDICQFFIAELLLSVGFYRVWGPGNFGRLG